MNIRKFAIAAGLVAAAGAAALACSGDDDDNNTVTTTDAGTDGATGVAFTHTVIKTFVSNVVTNQFANDSVVISYFAPNIAMTASSKATVNDIEECLAFQLGALLGNGDSYPSTVAGDGYVCRADMTTIHAPLFISGPVFDKFLIDVNAEATKEGVSLPAAATNALVGLKPAIAISNSCVPDADNLYSTVLADCTSGDDSGTPDASSGDDASDVDSSTPVDAGTDSAVADSSADAAG